jgi:hypothetical protein
VPGEPASALGLVGRLVGLVDLVVREVSPLVEAVRGPVLEAAGVGGCGRPEPGRVRDPDRVSVFAAQPGLPPLVRQTDGRPGVR